MSTVAYDQSQSNVEQIILNSALKSDVTEKLVAVPPDDRTEIFALFGRIVRVFFYEERFQGEWFLVALRGYVGKEEASEELRTVWVRKFSPPLPPIAKVRDAFRDTDVFSVSIGGLDYKFSKADGVYIGCPPAATSSQSL